MKNLPVTLIRASFNYEPESGHLRWKKRNDTVYANARIGKIAGAHDKDGYLRVQINKKPYPAHRIIWTLVTGKWPSLDIDHVNGIRDDNRWQNLRLATRQQNLWNMRLKATNTSGFKWVSWSKPANKWLAQIRDGKSNRYLGVFCTPEEAHKAALDAANKFHGRFARHK